MHMDRKVLCCSAALVVLGTWQPAMAQTDPAARRFTMEEVVVTARRKSESLQDVPASINVVSAEAVADLKLTDFTDLQTVVPGLTLSQDGSGTQTSASLRGVTFDASSTAPPTVAMYLNDAPVQSLFLYDSLFDIGQIEVLRGPQGTTRGISAPSGAITVTTRKPDLSNWGGYIQGLATDRDSRNLQAGIDMPLLPERLALRLSGVVDETEANAVESLRSRERPEQVTEAGRLSLLFAPVQELTADVSYTHIDKSLESFDHAFGPGQGTTLHPPLAADRRRAVQDEISDVEVELDVVTAKIDTRILGHNLTYVGSYQEAQTYALKDNDIGDILPGVVIPFLTTSSKQESTHEIRLSSESDGSRTIDYTVGLFHDNAETGADVVSPGPLLPGAFGTPAGAADLSAFDPRYQLPIFVDIDYLSKETSVFASATVHFGADTEVTAGVRHIWSTFEGSQQTGLGRGLVAMPPAAAGIPSCAEAALASTYGGFCDLPVPGRALPAARFEAEEQPTIYNVSISHSINEGLMVYATTGTAWRPPVSSPGLQGAIAGHPNPQLNTLTFHPDENSTNYEVGFKWMTLDGRARVNAAAFYQTFEDFTMRAPDVLYLNTATGQPQLGAFTASVDAVVSGVELDAAATLGNFNVSAQFSYANGDVDNSNVPCNITASIGPVFNTEGLISLCPGGSVSREPLWGATLQAEYLVAVGGDMEAYVRTLVAYKAANDNLRSGYEVEDYAITNLYLGLRGNEGAWEVTGFVRNLFGTERILDPTSSAYAINGSLGQSFPQLMPAGGSGYFGTEVIAPRAVGMSLRYIWGSR